MVILLPILFICIGLTMIFFRDFWWEITHWSNRTQGVASERTETWDSWTMIQGMIAIGAGALLLFLVLGASAERAQQEGSQTATASVIRAAAQTAVDDLNTRLSPYLTEWRDLATEERAYYVEPERFPNLRGLQVFYGRCLRDNGFYVYVFGYPETVTQGAIVYAYFDPPRQPSSCAPRGLGISPLPEPLSVARGWYRLRVFSEYQALFTRTPPPELTTTPTPNP